MPEQNPKAPVTLDLSKSVPINPSADIDISDGLVPKAQTAPTPPPGFSPVDISDGLVPKNPGVAPGVTLDLSRSVPIPPQGFKPVDEIDLSAGLVPKTQPKEPQTPPSALDKIHKGFEQGVADGFGLTAPDDDPHKLDLMDMMGQTWSNLKRSAIHSYENLGGASDEELSTAPAYRVDVPLRSAAAILGTPFDMIGTGIDSMATTIENGSKELVNGLKNKDHQAAARGAGKILASLGQIGVGMEGSAASDLVGKAGQVAEKAAPKPGAGLLRATSVKSYLYGKNPGRVFIDEPIKPTLSVDNLKTQIQNAGKSLDQQVRSELTDPAVAAKQLDAVSVVDQAVRQELQDLAKESGLKDRKAVIDAIKKVRDDVVNIHDADGNVIGDKSGPRTLVEANEMKKSIGRNTRWTGDPELENYVNSARKAMYGKLNDAIESEVGKAKPGTSIKALNARYANVIEASRLIEKRLAQEESGGFLGLGLRRAMAHGEWLAALGLFTHGEPLLGSLALADRTLRSTPGRMVTAQSLAGAGEGLQSAAKTGAPSTVVQGAAIAGSSGKWTRVILGNGNEKEVHPDDLEELQKRDPKLQVMPEEP